jgi:hypothetical protein
MMLGVFGLVYSGVCIHDPQVVLQVSGERSDSINSVSVRFFLFTDEPGSIYFSIYITFTDMTIIRSSALGGAIKGSGYERKGWNM